MNRLTIFMSVFFAGLLFVDGWPTLGKPKKGKQQQKEASVQQGARVQQGASAYQGAQAHQGAPAYQEAPTYQGEGMHYLGDYQAHNNRDWDAHNKFISQPPSQGQPDASWYDLLKIMPKCIDTDPLVTPWANQKKANNNKKKHQYNKEHECNKEHQRTKEHKLTKEHQRTKKHQRTKEKECIIWEIIKHTTTGIGMHTTNL
ncbi:hypothetical protein GPALN_014857 [Globodera pallida]|nr:hypothetical protein GPALN_014857 [Globodera pallida]